MNTLSKRHKSTFNSRRFSLAPSSGVFFCTPDEGAKPKRREVNLLLCLLFNVIILFIIKFILPAGGPLYKLLTIKDIYIYIYMYVCMYIYIYVCVCVCEYIFLSNVALTCPSPIEILNAHSNNDSDHVIGSIMAYFCHVGYHFPDGTTQRTIICLQNQTWSSILDDCLRNMAINNY